VACPREGEMITKFLRFRESDNCTTCYSRRSKSATRGLQCSDFPQFCRKFCRFRFVLPLDRTAIQLAEKTNETSSALLLPFFFIVSTSKCSRKYRRECRCAKNGRSLKHARTKQKEKRREEKVERYVPERESLDRSCLVRS